MTITSLRSGHSATDKTANAQTNFGSATPPQLALGEFMVAVVATDNISTKSGPTNDHTRAYYFQPGPGAQYMTKLREYTYSAGVAGDGVTTSIWILVPITVAFASPSNINVLFASALTAKAITTHVFGYSPGNVIDVAAVADDVTVGAKPEAIALSTDVWQQYLGIYGSGGEVESTAPLTPVGGWSVLGGAPSTSGGASDSNVCARGAYRIYSGMSVTADPSSLNVPADWAASVVALYEKPDRVEPVNVTVLDDFNRADGNLVNTGMWASTGLQGNSSVATIASNRLNGASSSIVSQALFGHDLDIIIDCVVAPTHSFFIDYALANPNTASITGLQAGWQINFAMWQFSEILAGGSTQGRGTSNSTEPQPNAGDRIWLRRRGYDTELFIKRSGNSYWKRILSLMNSSTYLRQGPIAIATYDPVGRWDNLLGGSVPGLFSSQVPHNQQIIDNFNRANGVIGAVAPWDGKTVNQTGNSTVAIASNTVVANTTTTSSIGTSGTYGPDQDLMIDCVTAMPGTGGNEYFGIYFCMSNTNSANALGYLLSIDNSPKWQVYRYTGFTDVLTPTSSAAIPAAGDTIWISRRGASIKIYVMRSGSATWTLILDIVDTTFMRSGKAGLFFYRTGASSAWDNFRGGTIPPAISSTKSLVIT